MIRVSKCLFYDGAERGYNRKPTNRVGRVSNSAGYPQGTLTPTIHGDSSIDGRVFGCGDANSSPNRGKDSNSGESSNRAGEEEKDIRTSSDARSTKNGHRDLAQCHLLCQLD